MKISINSNSESGSVLPLALITCLIIGMSLAAYLDLTGAQHRAVVRSEGWNMAIPLAEAGLEEAMTQAYRNKATLSADGWSLASSGLTLSNGVTLAGIQYYRSRTMEYGRYIAAISGDASPIITVQGILPSPLGSGNTVRTIQVTTAGGALFARGMVALGDVTWVGNILSDSFDSSDTNASVNGRYSSALRLANGSVGSVTGTFSMGGGVVYGSASIGPTGSFTTGSGGTVGDIAWISSNTGVQTGHFANDLNLSFPSVEVPFTSGYTIPGGGFYTNVTLITTATAVTSISYPSPLPSGGVVTNYPSASTYPTGTAYPVTTNVNSTAVTTGKGKNAVTSTSYTTNYTYSEFIWNTNTVTTNTTSTYYDHILYTGDYQLANISNGEQMLVVGNARLYVLGTISMSGQSQITIANTGTLNMYLGGDASLGGNGVVNSTADATRFGVWALPTCTQVSFGGNAEFTGTIYAPDSAFSAGGGGNTTYDVVGGVIANTIRLNGHFNFHYDERLGNSGPQASLVVTGWDEI